MHQPRIASKSAKPPAESNNQKPQSLRERKAIAPTIQNSPKKIRTARPRGVMFGVKNFLTNGFTALQQGAVRPSKGSGFRQSRTNCRDTDSIA